MTRARALGVAALLVGLLALVSVLVVLPRWSHGGATARPTPTASHPPSPSASVASPPASPSPTATPSPSVTAPNPAGEPVQLVVRSAAGETLVDAKVIPTRLKADGALEPPFGVVGWYAETGWPRPGFAGASIIAGHINSRSLGPDTFARLIEVRAGDTAEVTYESGAKVTFVVNRSEAVPKARVPADDSIWDNANPQPLLRLITCDPNTPLNGGHYVGNWVVWADLAVT